MRVYHRNGNDNGGNNQDNVFIRANRVIVVEDGGRGNNGCNRNNNRPRVINADTVFVSADDVRVIEDDGKGHHGGC
ncbi:hypothetical protein [Oceanobacillus senegalensis]|uniref:hypothetical protein n=1 Tax=Oceanobacillus senegalensis TaxID=1936063 RepID=UPI000A30AF59|nr:hypothetical protein [Oceanobacillus senegalensis]